MDGKIDSVKHRIQRINNTQQYKYAIHSKRLQLQKEAERLLTNYGEG